ncbi:unnamed protein product [Prorocentrum cordatum]|uniref:Fe2OG dioxygenase domain-containing protein n=1 Tax=Prorocentrum cordatum TaxID=2364126 RepID=A0ABN9SVY9_9DINO|nr:unnamed protein product [Polarella glacialis]
MDDVQEAFGAQLLRDGHLVIDGFLPEGHVTQLRSEVVACHEAGHLHVAGLVDSSINSVSAAKYENTQTRGDVIGWFDSDEQGWPYGRGLHNYLVKVGTMLSELGAHVPELKQITSRSKVMVACYPGGGARYVKHVDNDGKHPLCRTRLLTGLLYLNPEWKPGDGGELAIYEQSDKNVERRVVQPRGNRLLLFWSDWRTPHEVRPAQQPRYAVTLWFLHKCTDLRWAEEEELPAPVPAPASEAPSLDAASGDVTGTATPGVHTCGSGTDTTAAWATSPVDDGPGDSNNDDGKSDGGGGTVGRGHTGAHCEQLVQPAGDMVRHCWRRLEVQGGQLNDGAGRWELRVEVPGERPGCPVLEVSDSHVSVSSSSGAPLAQLPLPAGRWEASGSTWSRKRGLLATTFEALPTTPASSSTAAAPVAGPGDAGSAAAAAAEKAAAAAPCTRGRAAPVRHGWLRLGDAGGRESESAWELRVEVPGECPVLEVSEAQVCVASPGGRPLLRVPLPRGSWGPPANKWSRRRGLLTF